MTNVDLRLPNITGEDAETQIKQMTAYMYSLVEQLNWALSTVGDNNNQVVYTDTSDGSVIKGGAESERTFAQDRDLIIKNADEVTASYDNVVKELEGEYVAKSDFGTYLRKTDLKVAATPMNITQFYEDTQEIVGDAQKNTKAFIRTGVIDDTKVPPTYGILLGQNNNGTYTKLARFTTDGIEFFNGSTPTWAFYKGKLNAKTIDVDNLVVSNGNFTQALNAYVQHDTGYNFLHCEPHVTAMGFENGTARGGISFTEQYATDDTVNTKIWGSQILFEREPYVDFSDPSEIRPIPVLKKIIHEGNIGSYKAGSAGYADSAGSAGSANVAHSLDSREVISGSASYSISSGVGNTASVDITYNTNKQFMGFQTLRSGRGTIAVTGYDLVAANKVTVYLVNMGTSTGATVVANAIFI